MSWNFVNDEIIFDNYCENSPNNSFFGLLYIRETSHKTGVPECQKKILGTNLSGGRTLTYLISVQHILFFLRKFSQLNSLLEPPRLLISDKPATCTLFYVINIKQFPPRSD